MGTVHDRLEHSCTLRAVRKAITRVLHVTAFDYFAVLCEDRGSDPELAVG
jgi:hypothetical protein